MAAVLQHQIVGRVNDLNQKSMAHARIIFQISVELDKLRQENEELKKILKGHKIAIKQIKNDILEPNHFIDKSEITDFSEDVTISNSDLKQSYKEYTDNDSQLLESSSKQLFEDNSNISLNLLK